LVDIDPNGDFVYDFSVHIQLELARKASNTHAHNTLPVAGACHPAGGFSLQPGTYFVFQVNKVICVNMNKY
jgi:hypothetical protein